MSGSRFLPRGWGAAWWRSARPRLSLVIIAYQMARELPRTLRSLSPAMQRGVAAQEYEVIVLDNGSDPPLDPADCQRWCPGARLIRLPGAGPSPVAAINQGLAAARGELVGVWIDGARLASPGLLRGALDAARLHPRPVIGTLGFHLGPDLQARSIRAGYGPAREDELLASVDWSQNGYRLFEISCFAGSSQGGWFLPIAETNSLFLTAAHWRELGGYDPRFQLPGGGLANLDMWRRACLSPDSRVILLLGEGTFHQVHGGVATNAEQDPWSRFEAEYRQIRGEPWQTPRVPTCYLGEVPAAALPKLAWSLHRALEEGSRGSQPGAEPA